MHRLAIFFRSFLAMSAAWAFLHASEMGASDFLRGQYAPLFSRLFHAGFSSVVLILVILLLANQKSTGDIHAHKGRLVLLMAVILSVGWSWELTFDNALESILEIEGVRHPDAHHYKLLFSFGFAACLLPINAFYLKPIVLGFEEEEKKVMDGEDKKDIRI